MFPFSLAEIEKSFKQASIAVGVTALRITPHTMRHGGPSTELVEGTTSKLEAQSRGRWACLQSLNRYEKRGRLVRQLAKMPECQLELSHAAAAWLEHGLAPSIAA